MIYEICKVSKVIQKHMYIHRKVENQIFRNVNMSLHKKLTCTNIIKMVQYRYKVADLHVLMKYVKLFY